MWVVSFAALVLLGGCMTGPFGNDAEGGQLAPSGSRAETVPDGREDQHPFSNDSGETGASVGAGVDAALSEHNTTERERRLKARGFGLFDFSTLTLDSCEVEEDRFRDLLITAGKRTDQLEEKVAKKAAAVAQQHAALAVAEQLGDAYAMEREEDALHDVEEEFEELEYQLEASQELLGKLEILLRTLQEECARLEAGGL